MFHEKGHLRCEKGQKYEVNGALKDRNGQRSEMKGHLCERKELKCDKGKILYGNVQKGKTVGYGRH